MFLKFEDSMHQMAKWKTPKYCEDLSMEDFGGDVDAYIEARAERGMEAGYTFEQCYEHWLLDFGNNILCNSSDKQKEDNFNDVIR